MRFVFVTKERRLNPIAERVRNESHDVYYNACEFANPIVVTDKTIGNKEYQCIGFSSFNDALQDDAYNKATLVMSDVKVVEGEHTIDVSCWFNGMDFVLPVIVSINYDTFLEEGLGAKTSSMGCATIACNSSSKVFKDILLLLKPMLRKVSYMGMLTLECTTDMEVLRIEPYFKYDLLYAFFEGVHEEIGRMLQGINSGEKREFKYPDMYTIAVKVSIPPYPYTHIKSYSKELMGFCPENEKHIWLRNAVNENGVVSSIEGNGEVASITARGSSMQECRRRVYRTIRNLYIEEMQYRKDIGADAKHVFGLIDSWL